MTGGLDDLAQVTRAMLDAERAKLRDILRREAELRRALADLDERSRAVQAMPAADLAAPRAIGADLLWQGWVGRMRRDLNIELAQVLVQKAGRMSGLRRAFGRDTAIGQLIAAETKTARRKRARRSEETLQALGVMCPAARDR